MVDKEPKENGYYAKFVQLPHIREALHVGDRNFSDSGDKVEMFLRGDMYTSQAPMVQDILDAKENYRVMFYSGQLDIIVANILTENFLNKMKWHGTKQWTDAERKVWRVGTDVAGYSKIVDNLTFVLVRNAGHMVPADQPKWAFDMINRFTYRKPFSK